MTRDAKLGSPVVDHFPVYATDGYSKVSGVTVFSVNIWKEAVLQATAYTISEIGVTGEYEISFTPDSVGVWSCEVLIDTNKQIWYGEYDVSKADLEFTASMAEDGITARFTVWGDDEQGRATWLTAMEAEIRDSAGGLVTVLGSGAGPTADGTFLFTCLSALLSYNVPYYLRVLAYAGTIPWNGNCGFVRVK